MRHRATRIGLAALLALAAAGAGWAQKPKANEENSTRSVEGSVLDASKQPVSGAVVQIKDTKTLQIRSFITDGQGQYHFTGLSPNVDYELRAEHDGKSSGTKRLDVFNTKHVATIDLQLKK
ncbi:MAG TPA: carboxypeptidase-like regulatory domain-containing protein [Bryobacteraceae bacterium]|nr:carboxypeptidase-like regulatory domain-containing protein [Bryobacteraceae bacterium]